MTLSSRETFLKCDNARVSVSWMFSPTIERDDEVGEVGLAYHDQVRAGR